MRPRTARASARLSSRPRPGRARSGRSSPFSGSRKPSKSSARCARGRGTTRGGAASAPRRARALERRARSGPRAASCVRVGEAARRASSPVTPPQRVTSAWRQSTRAEQVAEVGGTYAYSPAAMSSPAAPRSRTSRSPSRSSELTGSSNHVTPHSARVALAPSASACFGVNAPFASTYSSASSPIASRAASRRVRIALRLAADLHLHARDAVGDPAAELLAQPVERVRA